VGRCALDAPDAWQPARASTANADIATQLKREAGLDIDKRKIEIDPPIRSLGPHEATIELHPEVTETLKVVVAAQ